MLTEMASKNYFLGADVSKNDITFFSSKDEKVKTILNTKRGLRSFLNARKDQIIALEATGGYEAKAIEVAMSLGMRVYRVNPFRIRAFMNASGQSAKTDALDAEGISNFISQHIDTLREFTPSSEKQKKIKQLARRREDLLLMRTQENNRLKAPDNEYAQKSIKKIISILKKQIKSVEELLEEVINKDEDLYARKQVLISVTGVGNTTAHNLLAVMPELGYVNRKEIASLAGLAPFARDSGVKSGYRSIGKGRADVRRMLFMAALVASRYNPKLKEFYERLVQKGKKAKVALSAVSRKLLVILNARLRDSMMTCEFPRKLKTAA